MKVPIWIAVASMLALLTTACDIGIELVVAPDGSGEMRSVLKPTEDEVRALSSFGMSSDELCSGMQSGEMSLTADAVLVQETDGATISCVDTRPFATLDDLETSQEGFTINRASIEGGCFVFDAVIAASGSSSGDGDFGAALLKEFIGAIYFRLAPPGEIDLASSNADAYGGNTATWDLMIGESRNVRLASKTAGAAC